MVQFSHPYMTSGKTIALIRQTFVSKVMSLLFNILSRLVIAFLPRNKRLLISCLQSPSTVIFEPKKIKSATVSIFSPSVYHEVMGPDAMILVFWILSFKPALSFSFYLHQDALKLLFAFYRKGSIICISEVVDMTLLPLAIGRNSDTPIGLLWYHHSEEREHLVITTWRWKFRLPTWSPLTLQEMESLLPLSGESSSLSLLDISIAGGWGIFFGPA